MIKKSTSKLKSCYPEKLEQTPTCFVAEPETDYNHKSKVIINTW